MLTKWRKFCEVILRLICEFYRSTASLKPQPPGPVRNRYLIYVSHGKKMNQWRTASPREYHLLYRVMFHDDFLLYKEPSFYGPHRTSKMSVPFPPRALHRPESYFNKIPVNRKIRSRKTLPLSPSPLGRQNEQSKGRKQRRMKSN